MIKTNTGGSYFRQCKHCGQAIHMRQMPAGQWVAFDDAERVHDCQNQSAYNDLYIEESRTLTLSAATAPTQPTEAEPLPTTSRLPTVQPRPEPPLSVPPVLPPSRASASRAPWIIGLLLLVAGIGWLTSSRISLRPVDTPLSQGTAEARENVRADDPAHTPTTGASQRTSTSVIDATEGGIAARLDLQTFDFIYVRLGPDIPYPEVGRVYEPRAPFTALGLSPEGDWVFGVFEGGMEGWVKTEFVLSEGSISGLPIQPNQQPPGVEAQIDL